MFSAPCSPIVSASWLPRGDGFAAIYQLVSTDTQADSTGTGLGMAAAARRMDGGVWRICLQRQLSGWRPGTEKLNAQRSVRVVEEIGKARQQGPKVIYTGPLAPLPKLLF